MERYNESSDVRQLFRGAVAVRGTAGELVSFDEQLFIRTVEQITVFHDKLVFVFRDGTEIPVEE